MFTGKLFTVKMTVSMFKQGGIPEEVIYYRQKLPLELLCEYKWYFEWLAALVKARHPHRKVVLEYFDTTFPCGEDWVRENLPKKLADKRKRLKTCQKKMASPRDLFGFEAEEASRKAENLAGEIEPLERGEYNYYTPPAYINEVRKWAGREKTVKG